LDQIHLTSHLYFIPVEKVHPNFTNIFVRGGKTGLTRRAGPFGSLFLAGWVEVLNSFFIVDSARRASLKNGAGRAGPTYLTRWKQLCYDDNSRRRRKRRSTIYS